jgi:ferredoxin
LPFRNLKFQEIDVTLRAEVYAVLAELFAEPPNWMDSAGSEWPLFDLLTQFSAESGSTLHHLGRLAGIPSESHDQREKRYTSLFASGSTRFWLYESAALTGKILGPQTFELAKLYRATGLEIENAELPDHISLELAFLSHLVGYVGNPAYEKQFIEQHGKWMIDLGCALAHCGDEVYAPIGELLADWLESFIAPPPPAEGKGQRAMVPVIPSADDCTLCGFCVQICPTHALRIHEDAENTLLNLSPAGCIGCGKCERICEFNAMAMSFSGVGEGECQTLRQSPRVRCRTCGEPIVSQAEMNFIAAKVGSPDWLHLCLECRAGLYI